MGSGHAHQSAMQSIPPACSKRLAREYQTLLQDEKEHDIEAHPESDANMLTWYFMFKGSADTPYSGGQYMGTLTFLPTYPFSPPRVEMITPSGRFVTNTRLCLSISDYHPETWNPVWNIRMVILGLCSFMSDVADPVTVGSIVERESERRRLALASHAFNASHSQFHKFTKFTSPKL